MGFGPFLRGEKPNLTGRVLGCVIDPRVPDRGGQMIRMIARGKRGGRFGSGKKLEMRQEKL
jgi:hypothetical protein